MYTLDLVALLPHGNFPVTGLGKKTIKIFKTDTEPLSLTVTFIRLTYRRINF